MRFTLVEFSRLSNLYIVNVARGTSSRCERHIARVVVYNTMYCFNITTNENWQINNTATSLNTVNISVMQNGDGYRHQTAVIDKATLFLTGVRLID